MSELDDLFKRVPRDLFSLTEGKEVPIEQSEFRRRPERHPAHEPGSDTQEERPLKHASSIDPEILKALRDEGLVPKPKEEKPPRRER